MQEARHVISGRLRPEPSQPSSLPVCFVAAAAPPGEPMRTPAPANAQRMEELAAKEAGVEGEAGGGAAAYGSDVFSIWRYYNDKLTWARLLPL